jgi:hypothetical protein
MLEKCGRPVLPRRLFMGRMGVWLLLTAVLLAVSILLGVAGYHYLEGMPWIDALLNAAMLLGGMGPVDVLHTVGGKLFASVYALYCGLVLIIAGGLFLVPVFHRVLHKFHADAE